MSNSRSEGSVRKPETKPFVFDLIQMSFQTSLKFQNSARVEGFYMLSAGLKGGSIYSKRNMADIYTSAMCRSSTLPSPDVSTNNTLNCLVSNIVDVGTFKIESVEPVRTDVRGLQLWLALCWATLVALCARCKVSFGKPPCSVCLSQKEKG